MIWTAKATRVALPNTYHQLTFLGTGCWIMGRTAFEKPSRRSNQRTTGFTGSSHRDRAGQDFNVAIVHPRVVAEQRVRRRPTADRAIGIIDATVAGTQKELGIGLPTHRAAQVGAADGERNKLCLVLAT